MHNKYLSNITVILFSWKYLNSVGLIIKLSPLLRMTLLSLVLDWNVAKAVSNVSTSGTSSFPVSIAAKSTIFSSFFFYSWFFLLSVGKFNVVKN